MLRESLPHHDGRDPLELYRSHEFRETVCNYQEVTITALRTQDLAQDVYRDIYLWRFCQEELYFRGFLPELNLRFCAVWAGARGHIRIDRHRWTVVCLPQRIR